METTEWEKRGHVVPVWSDVSHYRKKHFFISISPVSFQSSITEILLFNKPVGFFYALFIKGVNDLVAAWFTWWNWSSYISPVERSSAQFPPPSFSFVLTRPAISFFCRHGFSSRLCRTASPEQ